MEKHFTATTYIVNNGKVLLHLHKKLGIWLAMGGHVDANELPEATALREIKEESGLDVSLYNPDKQIDMGDVEQLHRPMHILLEDIGGTHQHIDFIYYAKSKTDKLNPQEGEGTILKWFTAEDIAKLEKEAPENVKVLSLKAIESLNE